jgi:hypothetical protein
MRSTISLKAKSKKQTSGGNKDFVTVLDKRHEALETGTDQGFTIEQLEVSIDKLGKRNMANRAGYSFGNEK